MPRESPVKHAQRNRDEGVARLRRITVYSGLGAVALTAIVSLIAATTIPGHSQAQPAVSTPVAAPDPGVVQPTLQPVAPGSVDPAAGSSQGQPPIVSGGS